MADSWLSVSAAASRVRRSEGTVRRWVRDGDLLMVAGRVRESDLVDADRRVRRRVNQHAVAKIDTRAALIVDVGEVTGDVTRAAKVADVILARYDVRAKNRALTAVDEGVIG